MCDLKGPQNGAQGPTNQSPKTHKSEPLEPYFIAYGTKMRRLWNNILELMEQKRSLRLEIVEPLGPGFRANSSQKG